MLMKIYKNINFTCLFEFILWLEYLISAESSIESINIKGVHLEILVLKVLCWEAIQARPAPRPGYEKLRYDFSYVCFTYDGRNSGHK